jgi:copper chaperone
MCNTTNDLDLIDKNAACNCSTDTHAHTDASAVTSTAPTADYLVSGMTCSHCVASVTEELIALDGVESVNVDLNAGGASKVTVASATLLDEAAVRTAVEQAGYALVDA